MSPTKSTMRTMYTMDIVYIVRYMNAKGVIRMTKHTASLAGDHRFVINQAMLVGLLKKSNPTIPAAQLRAVVRAMVGSGVAVADAMGLAPKPLQEAATAQSTLEREEIQGEGLGEVLPSSEEGMALLRDIAVEVPLEDWAGEVATPTSLCDRLGVSRSAINAWRQSNDVIALPKGKRGHVYPLLQFKDGRPIKEIKVILGLTSNNDLVAWRWLTTPNMDFEFKTPIEALREGEVASVLDAAHGSFD